MIDLIDQSPRHASTPRAPEYEIRCLQAYRMVSTRAEF